MKLRVHRSWHWVQGPGPLRLGGPPNLVLQSTDVLQMDVDGQWVPVPVVEDPAPEHPAETERKERAARMHAQMQTLVSRTVEAVPPAADPAG